MKIRISIIVLLMIFCEITYATDYYVNAVSGDNSTGDGTSAKPWKTITYALSQINTTGHLIHVASGTYNAALGETFPILVENGVSMVGAGKTTTIIDPAKAGRVLSCIGITDPTTVIEGFTITNGSGGSEGGGFYISAGSVLTIRNNIISSNITGTGGEGGGLYITNSSPLILSNSISGNSAGTVGDGNAIAMNNASPLVKGNIILNNTGNSSYSCIYIYGSSSSPRILNNVIVKNFNRGIDCYAGIPTIINNTISDNTGDGIYIRSSVFPDSILNNIISYNSGYGIREYGSSSDPGKVQYNLFYGNLDGLYYNEGSTSYYTANSLNAGVTECKNNINGAPLFIDKKNNDYHERSYSFAIDAGEPSFAYLNEPSPNGSRINIGAYGNTSEAATYLVPPVLSTDLYVNASAGNNSTGNGSSETPWKTITYALGQIVGGTHTIHVAAGTYNSALGETFPITMINGISLVGAGKTTTIIDAGHTERVLSCIALTDPSTIIEGLTITNGSSGSQGGGIIISGGTVLTIRNNIISSNGVGTGGEGGGIYITNSSPSILNNTISGNSGGIVGDGNAVALNNASPLIKGNILINNTASSSYSCIYIYGSASSPRILNNVIAKNTNRGIDCHAGIPTIINNTISDNTGDGIYINSGVSPDSIINNIISYNSGYGIRENGSSGDPVKVWYNLFYSNTTGLYYDEGSTGYFDADALNTNVAECKNNLTGDPLFINRTNNNYHILSGSPAINTGDPASPNDPDSSPADVGAFYYEPSPVAPNALPATNITHLSFDANWSASDKAAGYYLDIATDAGFTAFVGVYNNKNVENVTKYSITGLNPNTAYYYRVRAYNDIGSSGSSNIISLATLQIPAPGAPTALAASSISQTSFSANWNASATSTGYYLDVATDNSFTNFVSGYNNKNIANVTTSSVTGLSPYTVYYYRIRAYNAGGISPSSNVISLTTLQILPPAAPSASAATNITQTSFNANWNTSATATGYYLDLATDASFAAYVAGYSNKDVGNVTTFAITGLSVYTAYFYRVRAYNAGGASSNSIVISATTIEYLPPDPTANDATNIGQKGFKANWSSSANAAGYYLDVATDKNFTTFVAGYNNKDVLNVLSYNITGLNINTLYYYRVRAYNTGGTSGNSNTITVNTLQIPVSEYYVSSSGDNSTGNGTVAKPWKTITYALAHISGTGRHKIHVAAGTYNPALGESFPLVIADSVLLIGAGKDETIINANSSNYVIHCAGILDPEVRIEGFTITGGKSVGPGGIYISASSALLITNNLITLNYAQGEASGGAVHILNSSPRIENNRITSNHGVEIDDGATIYIKGATSAPLISGNYISGNINDLNAGGGVVGAGTVFISGSSGVKVQNNILLDNDPGGPSHGQYSSEIYFYNCSPSIKYNLIAKSSGSGILGYYTSAYPTIINNTISDNTYHGIDIYAKPDSIFNNIISYNSGYGIREETAGSDPEKVWYNLFYQNGSGLYYDEATTAITSVTVLNTSVAECKNNLSGDPLFKDKTNNNYHLTAGSPAIDAGDPASPSDPDGSTADIGAYYLIPPPAAPVAAEATSITYSGFQANWNASATATGYYLDVATDMAFTGLVTGFNNLNVNNVTTYPVTGLKPSTIYYFRVRAYHNDGTGPSSNVINLTTLQAPIPGATTAIAATNIGQTDFTANWNISALATGYYLDVATDNTFTTFVTGFNKKDVLNLLSYNITGLTKNTTYFYRVWAYNSTGTDTTGSNTITVTTLLNPPSPPSAPVANAAIDITQTTFKAGWSTVSGATGYTLDVATDNAFSSFVTGYNNKDILNSTSCVVSGLTANTNYYYRVRASNSGGTSPNSVTITVKTLINKPSPPVSIAGSNISQTGFTARWNSSATATGYRLDISTDNSFATFVSGYDNKDVGNVTSSSVSGLSLNTAYYYRVRAYNSGGTSDNSNTITVTTLLNPPSAPSAVVAISASGITQTGFTARWNSEANASGYKIDVSLYSTFSSYISGYYNLDAGDFTSKSVSGLTAKTTYYYRIRGYNSGGTGVNSNIISVTTLPNAPSAPTGLTGSSCSGNVTLSWSASTATDFLKYRIYGGTSANPTTRIDSTADGTISETTKTVSGLTHGLTYYFRITTVISPGIESTYSSPFSIKVKTGVVPVIKAKWNDILICYNIHDSLTAFQWYKDASVISGGTKQYYVTNKQPGSYYVMTTDKNNCVNPSNVINISSGKSLSLFPNPAKTSFTLTLFSESYGNTFVILYNSTGTKVAEYQTYKTDNELKYEVPASNLHDGIYTLQVVVNDEEVSFSRIIIVN